MTLAEAHNWTPEQVDRMDPQFLAELLAQKQAHADYLAREADLTPEQREKKMRDQIKKRKAGIVKRRDRYE